VTAHAPHLTPELLSAYLDRELAAGERGRVEDHLAACPGCRARLDGLGRVVGSLARLERAAPPSTLAQHVERRVALERRPTGLLGRLEGRLSTFAPQSPVLVTFTVVLALAVVAYLFAWGVAQDGPPTIIQTAPADSARPLLERVEAREVAGRRFALDDAGRWREVGAEGEAAVTVACGTPEAAAFAARHPWLAELTAGGRGVVFRDGEDVVMLDCR